MRKMLIDGKRCKNTPSRLPKVLWIICICKNKYKKTFEVYYGSGKPGVDKILATPDNTSYWCHNTTQHKDSVHLSVVFASLPFSIHSCFLLHYIVSCPHHFTNKQTK